MPTPTPENPLIWSSETLATRLLTALGAAHPEEYSRALSELTGFSLDPADPATFICEDQRIDQRFRTVSGQEVIVEVKVDHQATAEQLGRYAALAEGACRVMVVPDAAAPDVREATTKQRDWAVVTWSDLLGRLMDVNPLVARLERDVRVMASDPGAKAVTRRALHVLLPVKHERLEVEAGTTGRNWPCLNIAAKDGWVFGQVERAGAAVPPQFQAKVGFTISPEEQEPGPAAACMGEALRQAWQAAVALESAGRFSISRHGGASKMQKLYGTDFPYQARGYVGDYVGIYSTPLSDPEDALAQVVALGERMLVIADEKWGRREAAASEG